MKKNIVFGMLVSLLAIPTYTQAQEVATENGSASAEAVAPETEEVAPAAKQQAPTLHYSTGSVISVGFGAGCGGMRTTGDNVKSSMSYPTYNISLRYTYYFRKFMGFTTGVEFSTFRANFDLQNQLNWAATTDQGINYLRNLNFTDQAAIRSEWSEVETVSMVEVPLALSFKAKPNKVGFIGTLGIKLGFPVQATYKYKGSLNLTNQFPELGGKEVDPRFKQHIMLGDNAESDVVKYDRKVLSVLNCGAFAEAGILFQVHPRIDMSLSIYGSYYINSINGTPSDQLEKLGFGSPSNGLNIKDANGFVMNSYKGLIGTDVVDRINPFNCGVKLALHINCREKSDEQLAAEAYIAPEVVYVYDTVNTISVQLVHDTLIQEVRTPCDPEFETEEKEFIYYNVGDAAKPIFQPADLLDKLANRLKADPEVKVVVAGHSSPEGNPIYNEILAQKRADTVARMLIEKGVNKNQLIVRSYGSERPSDVTGMEALVKDRRVEIIPDEQ